MQQFQHMQHQQAIAALRQQQQQGTAAMQQQQQQHLEQMQQMFVGALPSGRECDVAIDAEGSVLDLDEDENGHVGVSIVACAQDENGHEFGDGRW
eukprot:COSAG01_NODE_204_length_22090_cov_64.189441_17_plen_95_part_00